MKTETPSRGQRDAIFKCFIRVFKRKKESQMRGEGGVERGAIRGREGRQHSGGSASVSADLDLTGPDC